MITEIVSFDRHPGMDRDEMVRDAAETCERWTDFPGLVRKMFMRDPDTLATKGIYRWETLEDADKGHDDAWLERSEEHTSELQSLAYLVCRLLLEKKKNKKHKKYLF